MYSYVIYRIGQFIALSLPLKAAYRLAVFISDIRYLFARTDRRTIRENLKAIFSEKSEKDIYRIRLNVFRNFAKYLVDFFRFEKLDSEYIKKNIRIENIHYFDEALNKGKGVIVLTAHLGNWELGGVVLSQLGYPFWAVALPHKDKRVDAFFNSQRASKGMKVIPLGRAVRTCINLLKENKMVALVGDRDFTVKGITVDFFGKPSVLPEGPAAFALQTGALIVPGFMLRNDDNTFTLRIEKPIGFEITKDKKENIISIMNTYKKIFEDYIRRYPDQWYMFRRFWTE